MKQLLFSLAIFTVFLLNAQPVISITGPTPPTRDHLEIQGYCDGKYVMVQNNPESTKRTTGKLFLYSADNKVLAQRDYKLNFKFNTIAMVKAILKKDKVVLFTAASGGNDWSKKPVLFWRVVCQDITMQEYDLSLQPIGAAKTIAVSKENYYNTSLVYSNDGKYFALIGKAYKAEDKFRYQLFNEKGEEIFAKDYSVPQCKYWTDMSESAIQLKDNGDLVFIVSDKNKDNASDAYIYVIESATQKIYSKKLEVAGKMVSNYPEMFLGADGSITLAYDYGLAGKLWENKSGIAFDKLSSTLSVIAHKEIPFSAEAVKRYADSKQPGTLKSFRAEFREVKSGGYVAQVYERVRKQTGPEKWDMTNNNLFCIGFNDKFEVAYEHFLREVPKGSNWIIYRPIDIYTSGDNVYVFHGGTDDKVKNTKEEFEMYCTWWQHGKTQPQTIKVTNQYADVQMYTNYREIGENTLLLAADANAYFVMKIANK
ncbi:MAG TPA: hypothetical protein VK154_01150 [Chitinophagales bacterium]|nr:hypothetical protein [Chitinophagales bacterium]